MRNPKTRLRQKSTVTKKELSKQRNLCRSSSTKTPCSGVLELHPRGYGFLRDENRNLTRSDSDVFVSESLVNRLNLSAGTYIDGTAHLAKGKAGPKLVEVNHMNGHLPVQIANSGKFDELSATNPYEWMRLEHADQSVSMNVLDLLCPFGFGQRALIASPPRAGKTTLLKQIGRSIAANHSDVHLAALLIDERPEEVTDMRDDIDGEVFASSLDETPSSHSRLARLVMQRCQRIAETGKDVVLLVDSLTRLARACNKIPSSLSTVGAGGLHLHALELPKQLFASARAFKEGGSLTIIATVLVDTENRMDEVIFREFKGTGNLDIVLSQELADRRIWPAIDIAQSATRRIELIHDPKTFEATTILRNSMLSMPQTEAMKELVQRLQRFQSNAHFVETINRSLSGKV